MSVFLTISALIGIMTGYTARGRGLRYSEKTLFATAALLIAGIGARLATSISREYITSIAVGAVLVALVPSLASIVIALITTRRITPVIKSSGQGVGEKKSSYTTSLFFALFFFIGILCGYFSSRAPSSKIIEYLLLVLVFTAGYSIGGMRGWLQDIARQALFLSIALSASTMIGGVLGGLIISRIQDWDIWIGIASSIASGWYSLAGPLLSVVSPAAGAIAFLGNMFRETLHILLYPLLARKIPYPAITMGGATTMDTGLPVIAVIGDPLLRLTAFMHGTIITLLLSVILPFYVEINI